MDEAIEKLQEAANKIIEVMVQVAEDFALFWKRRYNFLIDLQQSEIGDIWAD